MGGQNLRGEGFAASFRLLQTTSPTLSDSMARSPFGVDTLVPAAKQQGSSYLVNTTSLLLATSKPSVLT